MAFPFAPLHRAAPDLLQVRGPAGHSVPVLDLVSPVYMDPAFTHYGLAQLEQARARP